MIDKALKFNSLTIIALVAMLLSALSVSALPFRGIVTDSLKNRQGGATVELYEPKQGIQRYTIQANDEGYFEFQNIMEMDYQIRVTTQEYPTQWCSKFGNTVYRQYRTRIGMAVTPDTFTISVVRNPFENPPNNTLTILLVDSAGNALVNQPSMSVALYRSEDYYETAGQYGGTGGSTLVFDTLQAGKFAVVVRSPNFPVQYYHPERNTSQPKFFLDIGGGQKITQTVVLVGTPTGDGGFRGVCRSGTDVVLSGVVVSVCQTIDTFKVLYSQTTGKDGVFIFSNIMESYFYLKFAGAGYPAQWYSFNRTETTRYPENTVWSMHAPNDTLLIRLSTSPVDNPASGSISIGVMDSTGRPVIAGGNVELIDAKTGVGYTPGFDTTKKRFLAVNIPAGQYFIKLNFPPYPTQYYTPAGTTSAPAQVINVTINTNPFFDAKLQKNPGQPGTTSTGYGTIKGSVKDSTGQSLGDVMVLVFDRNFTLLRNIATTIDGLFYMSGVPTGPVFVGMKSPQYQLQFWSPQEMTFTQSAAKSMPLSASDTLIVNATLVRTASTTLPIDTTRPGTTSGGMVRGKVMDKTTGVPLRNVRIVLADNLPSGGISPRNYWSPWVTYTDSTGSFIFSNVGAGSYRAMAEADSQNYIAQFYPKSDAVANAKVFSIVSGTSMTVDFSLRKGGIVRGSIINSAGGAVVGAHVNLTDAGIRFYDATTGSDGIYSLSGIPNGVWNLWVNHADYLVADNTMKREIPVTEGSSMAVPAITMERGSRISGTFTSPLPLNDTAFVKNMYQGLLQLYADTVCYSGSTVWPSAVTSIRLEPTVSSGYGGAFRSDAIKPGNYRMIFTPFSGSGTDTFTAAASSAPRQGLGYSFVGSGTTFGTASKVRLNANDTTGGLVLTLRKGWILPGRLKDESGAMMGGNCGVEVFVKQDSLFVRIGYAPVTANGRFELAGLIENEEYYFMPWAPGYPSQFWSVSGNTAGPTNPYRFTVETFQPLECTIRRAVAGGEPGKVSSPVSLWIKDDSLGQPLLAWSIDATLSIDNFIIYRTDRLGNVVQLATIARSTASTYTYRDVRTATNFREYVIVAKGAGVIVRSDRTGFDPRSSSPATPGLWLDVNSNRSGIQLEWGLAKGGTFTNQDSINVFRATGSEVAKLLFRVPVYYFSTNDQKWSRSDSGKTFTYYLELPSKQLVSPRISKTLDAAFFAAMGRTLTVGPYEKYQRIADAITVANDFDIIEVRAGIYSENINFAGKNISLNGSWDYGKPPIIDGGGSVAITIPYCSKGSEYDRPRISGFVIRNSSNGIKAQSAIDVEECLFDNVTVALSMTIDSAAMVRQILVNPFRSNTLDGGLRHCTFIAKKPGSMIGAATAIGIAEEVGYTGQYAGREQFYIQPAVSFSSAISMERSIFAFYQSSGMQTTLPVTLQGKTSRITIRKCNFWQTATTSGAAGSGIVDSATMLDPQFTDSSYWFVAITSPLAGTTYETRIGYDVRTLYQNGSQSEGGVRPKVVKNITAATVGLTTVVIRWDAAPVAENVKRYRIYRLPGDPALYYIDQRSQWNIKVAEDSLLGLLDSFSTDRPIFMDTSAIAGKPYLYLVTAVNSDGNEGDIALSAPPDIATYFVNKPADRVTLVAGKWQMIGGAGASAISLNADSRHALFDWDGSRIADKTLANYGRAVAMQATKGYWFKPAVDTVLTMNIASFEALRQIESTASVRLIKGSTGWNLVASPFPFTISPEWLGTYTAWEWNADSIGYRKAQVLRPWKAYWMYSDRDTTLQLLKKQQLNYYATRPLGKKTADAALWQLRLILQSGQSWDCDNFVGLMPNGLAKSMQLESPEPPAAFDGARLFIINQQNGTAGESQPARLAQLFKTSEKPGAKLEWMVGIGASGYTSTLTVRGIAALPDDLYAFWVEEGRVINLREQTTIDISAHATESYGYLVITATPGDLALYTGKLALLTPYPNPFAGSATIGYVLPYAWSNGEASANGRDLPLSLKLYSITGKLVTTLVNERRAPGVYRTVWNGENSSGAQVATGMYIMKLSYGKSTRVTRLYRIR